MKNLIRHDWCNGIKRQKMLLTGLVLLTFINCIMIWLRIGKVSESSAGLSDYLYGVYGGERSLEAMTISEIIRLPVPWMVMILYILIPMVEYPLRDLRESGRYSIVRCRNIAHWWYSKMVWCVLYNMITHIVIIITCLISTLVFGGMNSGFHSEFFEKRDDIIFAINNVNKNLNIDIIHYVSISIIIMLLLSLFFMAFAYITSQMVGMIASIICICLSVFYKSDYFSFNQTMIARTAVVDAVNIVPGIGVAFILMALANLIAIKIIKKRDIY